MALRSIEFTIAARDAEHHMRFIGTAWRTGEAAAHCPSPVDLVTLGTMPLDHLD